LNPAHLVFALLQETIVVSLSAESFFSKESWALATRYSTDKLGTHKRKREQDYLKIVKT